MTSFTDDIETPLDLSPDERRVVFDLLGTTVEEYIGEIGQSPVACAVSPGEIRAHLAKFDFEAPQAPREAVLAAADMLSRWATHVPHPGYFGLFNPAPTFMGIVGDTLTAAFNPQLAVWSHAPAAVEIENHVLAFVARRIGLPAASVAGSFTSGGAEANHTAVLVALTKAFPELARAGLRGLDRQPVFYASAESHLAWLKVARATGLGEDALRLVPAGDDLRLDVHALDREIRRDREAGHLPFFVAATAGTTNAGVIDPLPELADLCRTHGLYLHVDAAWAGAVVLSDRLRPLLDGVEQADSVTIDAHKWLSVPMGAGMFIGTDPDALLDAFRVSTGYMPGGTDDAVDPYAASMQWSRRFTGLKVFLSLLVAGRAGYAEQIERSCRLGDALRDRLTAHRWRMVNSTPLPVVCFTPADQSRGQSSDWARLVAAHVVRRGHAWLSATRLRGQWALRACITNHRTTEKDVATLVAELELARKNVA